MKYCDIFLLECKDNDNDEIIKRNIKKNYLEYNNKTLILSNYNLCMILIDAYKDNKDFMMFSCQEGIMVW